MKTTKIRAAVATAAIAATVLSPAMTSAANANDVAKVNSGGCSGAASWKLKLAPRNGGIEVEYEVDTNRTGQRFKVSLFHQGNRVMRTVRTTRGISGSFSLHDRQANLRGADHVRARAVSLANGQTCVGRATA